MRVITLAGILEAVEELDVVACSSTLIIRKWKPGPVTLNLRYSRTLADSPGTANLNLKVTHKNCNWKPLATLSSQLRTFLSLNSTCFLLFFKFAGFPGNHISLVSRNLRYYVKFSIIEFLEDRINYRYYPLFKNKSK